MWHNIRRKNRQYSNFSGVMTPLKQFWRGHWPRRNNFSGVIDSTETTRIFLTKFCSRNYKIVKQLIWPRWTLKLPFWDQKIFFKREYPAKLFKRKISPYNIWTLTKKKSWEILDFNDPAETEFDDFRSDYLGEYEAMQNGFSPWIRALDGVDWWKNEGRKSLATVPLSCYSGSLKLRLQAPQTDETTKNFTQYL
jgi:hypothetical protein